MSTYISLEGVELTVVRAVERIVVAVDVVLEPVNALLEAEHVVVHLLHLSHLVHDVCERSVTRTIGNVTYRFNYITTRIST
jgi:hypothetical protein